MCCAARHACGIAASRKGFTAVFVIGLGYSKFRNNKSERCVDDMYEKRYRDDVALCDNVPNVVSAGSTATSPMSAASALSSSSSSLSAFVVERSLPSVVQVLAGCYGNISVNKDNELYVHSTSQQTVVIAESLVAKSTTMIARSARRLRTTTGQTLSLPLDYDGPSG